jgi:hypothetical protein
MSVPPDLPARVENPQHLAELVTADPDSWYHCLSELHTYTTTQTTQSNLLDEEISRLQELLDNKILDNVATRTRLGELEREL